MTHPGKNREIIVDGVPSKSDRIADHVPTRLVASAVRVAILTNIPAPYRVATWNHLALLAGGRVTVLFVARSESRRTWTVPAHEMKFKWEVLSSKTYPPDLFSSLRASVAVLCFLAWHRPHSVICGGYDSLPAWTTFAWSKITRRRFVLWLEANERRNRKANRIKTFLKRLVISRADAIAASGKATVRYVKALGAREERLFLAPFGDDYLAFRAATAKVNADQEKKLRGYPSHLVLYSGRLVREKGVFVLLEAFRRVSAELPDAGLLVVGDGPERKSMEDFCRHFGLRRVYFIGAKPYDEMPYFYCLADLLVLPTFEDRWGFVVNEGFACGVPAIVSRAAGVCDDLIIEGKTGFVMEEANSGELADRILFVLSNPGLRAAMRTHCTMLIREYSAQRCAEGLFAAAVGTT